MTGEGRRSRQLDRASELDEALQRVVDVAHLAVGAHAVLYFDLDRQREQAHLRAAQGPAALLPGCAAPLGADPFSFLVQRGQPFYATDFKRLLWELPWYRGQVQGGLAPRGARARRGRHRRRARAPTGSRSRPSPATSRACSTASRASPPRPSSAPGPRSGARSSTPSSRRSTRSPSGSPRCRARRRCGSSSCAAARHLTTLEGGAVAMADDLETRYVGRGGLRLAGGLPQARGRASTSAPGPPGSCAARRRRTCSTTWAARRSPCRSLVLDEGSGRAESLLAVPLRARNRTLGALVLTGARGAPSTPSSRRVLEILANQAAATDPAHQGQGAAAPARRARRPHRALQPAGVRRAARRPRSRTRTAGRAAAWASSSSTSTTSRSSTTPTATPPATRRSRSLARLLEASTCARATRRRATAARSSW